MRFVGRDRELKKLNELYQEEEFQFVVIYGRRRVGKTMLINEFLKKKRSAYYMAVELYKELVQDPYWLDLIPDAVYSEIETRKNNSK